GNVSVVGGVPTATFTTTATQLGGGNHVIVAVYNGDTNFANGTSASFTQTVNPHPTTTTITNGAPNPSTFRTSVTSHAAVTPAVGSVLPTGTVQFRDGAPVLGTVSVDTSGATATATFQTMTTQLSGGVHTQINAVYSGDANFANGTSANFTQTVN